MSILSTFLRRTEKLLTFYMPKTAEELGKYILPYVSFSVLTFHGVTDFAVLIRVIFSPSSSLIPLIF